MRRAIESRRDGFTLIELLVVIAIIGLLISLILVASADGVRRAEERATQSLITKLETALNDRLDALLNSQAPINQTHRFLASINSPVSVPPFKPIDGGANTSFDRRAQVIAQFDYLRAELPDTFFLNVLASDGATVAAQYPLNFAAAPYPAGTKSFVNSITGLTDGGSWVLPLGNNYPGVPLYTNPSTGVTIPTIPGPAPATTGMFGASFSAAAGFTKNIYIAAAADLTTKNPSCTVNITPGFDGIDNNGDGLVDELTPVNSGMPEVVVTGSPDRPFSAYVAARLANHTHKTARSEALYAVLVEGLSPLGSSFSRDDFTAREVQDTDGDGMPEFIDAWGEPLQFFRWPLYYGGIAPDYRVIAPNYPGIVPIGTVLGTSDSQRGYLDYLGPSFTREQDPLDPNQLLVSPGWWSGVANPGLPFIPSPKFPGFNPVFVPPNGNATNYSSPAAIAFMNNFHSLVDPFPGKTNMWDRGSNFTRRAYFTKVLILSAGPDREPGVALFGKDYAALVDNPSSLASDPYAVGLTPRFPSGTTMEQSSKLLIYIENQAGVTDPLARINSSSGSFFETPDTGNSKATVYLSAQANGDDITNHNISGISTGVR